MSAAQVEQVARLVGWELEPWQQRLLQRTSCAVPGCHRPGRLMPRGRRCEDVHAPEQPSRGYCAPGRCYCRTATCERPA